MAAKTGSGSAEKRKPPNLWSAGPEYDFLVERGPWWAFSVNGQLTTDVTAEFRFKRDRQTGELSLRLDDSIESIDTSAQLDTAGSSDDGASSVSSLSAASKLLHQSGFVRRGGKEPIVISDDDTTIGFANSTAPLDGVSRQLLDAVDSKNGGKRSGDEFVDVDLDAEAGGSVFDIVYGGSFGVPSDFNTDILDGDEGGPDGAASASGKASSGIVLCRDLFKLHGSNFLGSVGDVDIVVGRLDRKAFPGGGRGSDRKHGRMPFYSKVAKELLGRIGAPTTWLETTVSPTFAPNGSASDKVAIGLRQIDNGLVSKALLLRVAFPEVGRAIDVLLVASFDFWRVRQLRKVGDEFVNYRYWIPWAVNESAVKPNGFPARMRFVWDKDLTFAIHGRRGSEDHERVLFDKIQGELGVTRSAASAGISIVLRGRLPGLVGADGGTSIPRSPMWDVPLPAGLNLSAAAAAAAGAHSAFDSVRNTAILTLLREVFSNALGVPPLSLFPTGLPEVNFTMRYIAGPYVPRIDWVLDFAEGPVSIVLVPEHMYRVPGWWDYDTDLTSFHVSWPGA